MPDYDDDERADAMGWGPIIVRRPVYDEGMKMLDKAAPEDGAVFETARGMAQDCEVAGDEDKAAYWTEVAVFLEWRAAVAKGVKVIVLEKGEEWDREKWKKVKSKKKVRAGKNPRRSSKGS